MAFAFCTCIGVEMELLLDDFVALAHDKVVVRIEAAVPDVLAWKNLFKSATCLLEKTERVRVILIVV